METSIHITESLESSSDSDLSIDEGTPKIIFKIKKYYMICIQNGKNLEFDISKTTVKNILIYETFDKENQEQKAKKCGYRYFDQVSENWKNKIQRKQFIIQRKKDLKYV